MNIRSAAIAAVSVAAAAGVGLPALGLEGAFVGPSGTKATFSAAAVRVELPDGTTFDVPVMTEGNMLAFIAAADDPTCPGQTGTYTVSQDADGVTFTAQADDCEAREADLTGGVWAPADDADD